MKTKTIKVTCQGASTLPLDKLSPLQGELKTLPEENHARLRESILRHGITFPFFVWRSGKNNFIIDAHQREKVLSRLKAQGWEIPPVPVAWIDAASEAEAREKILLQNSQYGQMTEASLDTFLIESLLDKKLLAEETVGLPFSIEAALSAPVLKELQIQPPPRMAWALIGIPIQHFSKVQALLDQLPEFSQVHTTANDQAEA